MNTTSRSDSYAAAGVDITAGYKAVELMKTHIAKHHDRRSLVRHRRLWRPVRAGPDRHRPSPCWSPAPTAWAPSSSWPSSWTSTTPWASTAWPCASTTSSACGAKPLFFLDYIACGKNVPEKIADIVSGVAEGCVQAGCCPHRRRDRRDARLLSRGRVRPGRLLRGRGGQGQDLRQRP